MTIGIDLRVLQIGHQYRGIGAHVTNLIKEISKLDKQPRLIFFEYPNLESSLKLLESDIKKIKDYEARKTKPRVDNPGFFKREWQSYKQHTLSTDAGLGNLKGVEVMLCVDFSLGVPKIKGTKSALISYDMIPWVLSSHYLPNFFQVFKKTQDFKRSTKAQLEKFLYFRKISNAHQKADIILSISEHTKRDVTKYLKINSKKIKTVLLGVSHSNIHKKDPVVECVDANNNKIIFETKKSDYIFFMGGADRRRRIEDLIVAFDNIAKINNTMGLVLAGYDFQNPEDIPDQTTKEAIQKSKNKDKILLAGFVSNEQRNALYSDAVAYIFPSIYEGFGLPILEAMNLGCPVITYNNSSIREVGKDIALYAKSPKDIANHVDKLKTANYRQDLIEKGKNHVNKFTWDKCCKQTLRELKETL